MSIKPAETCFQVAADGGYVFIGGEHGLTATLTPEAAIDSADRLLEEASLAMGQRVMDRVKQEIERR